MTFGKAARVIGPAALLATTAFSPPARTSLPYDLAGILAAAVDPIAQPVEPGEQYPPAPQDRTITPVPEQTEAAPPAAKPRKTEFTLSIDWSITADSNISNSTDRREVAIDLGSGPLPVPLDPNLREKAGVGFGTSAAAALKVPVTGGLSVALGAEGYLVEYDGRRGDDASLLGAGGLEVSAGRGTGTVQVIAFDRWYAGVSAMQGYGLRANWRQEVGEGRHLSLYLDGRRYDSGYGRPFGGKQASAYLSYDQVLNPTLTAAGGVYVRRDDLREKAYASTEVGAYGNLTHYLTDGLTGGVSAGASRSSYDAPILFLSPEARRDWRYYGSLWLTTRRPIFAGLYPSLTYTYSRTASSIGFYDADRHRLRLGIGRSF